MPEIPEVDYYEVLQISPNADPDTVNRVYRLLAQRLHPDNHATGDGERFRALTEAYHVLGDAERRAQYDVHRPERQQERSRLISEALRAETEVESEQLLRITVLQLLYARRRVEPRTPGVFFGDLEGLVGRPREHLEFTLWYLGQKGFVDRTDGSLLVITADGVDHVEKNADKRQKMLRLTEAQPAAGSGI
jgi:curved DNA-binding protein CbpA